LIVGFDISLRVQRTQAVVVTQAKIQSVADPITQATRQTYVYAAEVAGDVQIAVRDREEQYRNLGIDLIGQQERHLGPANR
jgi:hypothetical protein